jgi:hypothetical protein
MSEGMRHLNHLAVPDRIQRVNLLVLFVSAWVFAAALIGGHILPATHDRPVCQQTGSGAADPLQQPGTGSYDAAAGSSAADAVCLAQEGRQSRLPSAGTKTGGSAPGTAGAGMGSFVGRAVSVAMPARRATSVRPGLFLLHANLRT